MFKQIIIFFNYWLYQDGRIHNKDVYIELDGLRDNL